MWEEIKTELLQDGVIEDSFICDLCEKKIKFYVKDFHENPYCSEDGIQEVICECGSKYNIIASDFGFKAIKL